MKDFFELDEKTIKKIVEEIKDPVRQLMGDNVKDIILFGSCCQRRL